MQKRLTIIIPAYNEEESLKELLPDLLSYVKEKNYDLIIVDDGSSDGTREALENIKSASLKVLRHKLNKGYGGAIKTAIQEVETEYCITIDADGQHHLEDVTRLFERITQLDADMIIGRRETKGDHWYRRTGKTIIRSFAKLLMKINIVDINSGMKIYRADLAKKYLSLYPNSMAFSDIIALVFISNRHLVLEEPIKIKPRLKGESTISTKTAIETINEILNIVVLFNPMRIFLPIAIGCVLFGLGWGLPFLLRGQGLSTAALLALITGVLFFFLGLIAEQLSLIRKSSL